MNDFNKEKVVFSFNINDKKQTKRVSSKILKVDENNQYGVAMTKPLPYGCIKKKDSPPSLTEFNKIISETSHEDNIGHLFTVDIKFHDINQKTLLFNELYPPIFEKKSKKIDPYERPTLQLMSIAVRDEEKDKFNSFPYNSKTHSTLKEKKFVLLYAEDLHFLITRAGWLVTHIYEHYTFEKTQFKKNFVVMNQTSRQTAASSVEKDFYKLLNNSNFGIDCRNIIDNCYLEPLYDDFSEISYIKNFITIFNEGTFRNFFPPCLFREEINCTYDSKIFALNKNEPTYQDCKKYYGGQKAGELDAVDSYEKNKNVKKKKNQRCR